MAEPSPDPFEGLVLNDVFVAAASVKEPRMTAHRGRWARLRRARRVALAIQTVVTLGAAASVALWAWVGPTSPEGQRLPGAAAPRGGTVRGVGSAGVIGGPVPEPWNDPVPELDVQLGPDPDWLVVGPPGG